MTCRYFGKNVISLWWDVQHQPVEKHNTDFAFTLSLKFEVLLHMNFPLKISQFTAKFVDDFNII